MKNLFLTLALLIGTLTFAQTETLQGKTFKLSAGNEVTIIKSDTLVEVQDEVTKKYSPYLAVGLSMVNDGDFRMDSYPSVELGVMRDNIAVGVVVGRGNLEGMLGDNDNIGNYFYEGKVAFYFPIGSVSGYGLLGAGSYISKADKDVFFEYGAGISKEFKGFSVFAQVSNWDGVTYVTPGVSINL